MQGTETMPVVVQGTGELLKALRAFEPDLAKNLNKEIRAAMTPVQKKAQAYVPGSLSGLSHWQFQTSGKKITAQTSAFAVKEFPKFNAGVVKAGIRIAIGKQKKSRSGFVSFYRISNLSAAGQIMEMAGRTNPDGRDNPPSHRSKKTGAWFISHQQGKLTGNGKHRGRILYKAAEEDQGRVTGKMMKALDTTLHEFQNRAQARSAWTSK